MNQLTLKWELKMAKILPFSLKREQKASKTKMTAGDIIQLKSNNLTRFTELRVDLMTDSHPARQHIGKERDVYRVCFDFSDGQTVGTFFIQNELSESTISTLKAVLEILEARGIK